MRLLATQNKILRYGMAKRSSLVAAMLAGSIVVAPAFSQSTQNNGTTTAQASQSTTPRSRYQPSRFSKRAAEYYGYIWGVDSLSVKWAESGEVIRFSYRVLDVDKAQPLNDKKNEPVLVDPQAGVKLIVPSLEKVGQLRQASPPEAGRSYWMAFSNKGRVVKRGDRVDVVIGKFRAEGLVVD